MTNLEVQNKALLLKHLHKFYSRADIPWVKLVWSLYGPGPPHAQSPRGSFCWKDVFSLVDIYRSITTTDVMNGETSLFWKDFWHGDTLFCDRFPHLYSFVLNEDVSVAHMDGLINPDSNFSLPMSEQAHEEYEEVIDILGSFTLNPLHDDARNFVWGNASLSAARFYKFIFSSVACDQGFNLICVATLNPGLYITVMSYQP